MKILSCLIVRPSVGIAAQYRRCPTTNGDIDTGTGFGKNEQGFVEIFFPGIHISFIFGVGPLADAGVLVTCQYYNGDSLGSALIRLLKDGRPDEGFGDGIAIGDGVQDRLHCGQQLLQVGDGWHGILGFWLG